MNLHYATSIECNSIEFEPKLNSNMLNEMILIEFISIN
jgi:hypothetical protein